MTSTSVGILNDGLCGKVLGADTVEAGVMAISSDLFLKARRVLGEIVAPGTRLADKSSLSTEATGLFAERLC